MRFQVQLNGEHICYAGLKESGALNVSIHTRHVEPTDPDPIQQAMSSDSSNEAHILIHGSHGYGKRLRDVQHVRWRSPEAKIGDELVIRLLPDGEVTEPISDGPVNDLHFSPLISFGTLKKLYRLLFVHGVSFSLGKPIKKDKDDQ